MTGICNRFGCYSDEGWQDPDQQINMRHTQVYICKPAYEAYLHPNVCANDALAKGKVSPCILWRLCCSKDI